MNSLMPGVEYVPTAAKGGYGAIKPIAIVNHIMQGYQSTMINWANERPPVRRASAHFTIGRDGRVVQHVPIDEAAWHSGNVQQPTWALMRYTNGTPQNPNGYTVGIEYEGFSVDPVSYAYDYLYSDAHPWPAAMVAAGIEVQQWVCDELGIAANTDTIIGHRAIDGVNRKYDPGDAWPQERMIQELTSGVLPPAINKYRGYMAIYTGKAKPIRTEGSYGVYELKVKL